MLTYKLAEQLKTAGFPQKDAVLEIYLPSLEELILACGEYFLKLEKEDEKWSAIAQVPENRVCQTCPKGQEIWKEEGETMEEAVSLLWLKLKKG